MVCLKRVSPSTPPRSWMWFVAAAGLRLYAPALKRPYFLTRGGSACCPKLTVTLAGVPVPDIPEVKVIQHGHDSSGVQTPLHADVQVICMKRHVAQSLRSKHVKACPQYAIH